MKIGIDARLYSQSGVGRYIRNLLKELEVLDKANEYFIILAAEDYHKVSFNNGNFHKVLTNITWHSWQEQLYLAGLLNRLKLDVVHFPYFSVPYLYRGKFIITIHDLIIDHFKTGRASRKLYPYYLLKRWAYRKVLENALRKSSKILAISKSTKKEIIDHYQINADKIVLTFDGLDKNFLSKKTPAAAGKNYPFAYFLFVGNAYPHKNLEKLITAFDHPALKKRLKLVLVGENDYFYENLKSIVAGKKLEKEVIFHGPAVDNDLISLYSHAEALVVPSLMEGFGLPNLEAAALNCPLIMSDIPVFREIWQDASYFFEPEDFNSIRKVLIEFLDKNKNELSEKIIKARKIALKYDWRKSARVTLLQYLKV